MRRRSSIARRSSIIARRYTYRWFCRLGLEGSVPTPGTPEDYAANMVREESKWAALVKKLGLTFE